MSKTVDQRIVEMQFDNRKFEQNVSTTMSTLDKLKEKLNLHGAAKGLENVSTAAKNCDVSGLGGAVETVRAKFSALEVMGVTALANITNSAVNAGKRMISALTIDPIKTGFSEYETKIGSIQTIMSNTASKGTTMEDVTRVINELNTYADKTIYNFAEMTRNIGTFTAAGVGLEESASAIQGIANLAAASGSTSQQASTAMYQLSQALAAGQVKLMDWNSVVNAGMGGEKFQEALKATAREHGVAVDALIKKNGSFRESLQEGWITADILNETLNKFTVKGAKEYAQSMMDAGKWTQEQADALIKEAQAMEDAATKVKTFTQLWDTLKEAAQSGWSQTWEIIVGDFEEAKELFTKVSDVIGGMIGKSADARNELLQGWKDAGGRADLIEALSNAFDGLMSILKPIGEAFREVFPRVTVEQLTNLTAKFKEFTSNLGLTGERAEKVKSVFKGLFSIASIIAKVFGVAAKAVVALVTSDGFVAFADLVLDAAAALGDFFTSINEGFNTGGISGGLTNMVSAISDVFRSATEGLRSFGGILTSIGKGIVFVANVIWDSIKPVFTWIADNISAGDIFAGLAGGGIFVLAKKLSGFIDNIVDAIKGLFDKAEKMGLKEKFAEILGSIGDTLQSFTAGIKIWSLVGVAVAVGILSMALNSIAELEVKDISKALFAIGALLTMLTIGFRSLTKSLSKFESKGIVKSSFALILVASAINILADAMVTIAQLSLREIAKGLIGIGGGLAILCVGLKNIFKAVGDKAISLKTSVVLLALAKSCEILADGMIKISALSWNEIAKGLVGMGVALAELVTAVAVLGKFGGVSSLWGGIAIFVVVQSLSDLAEALKKFGGMSWGEIIKGLTAMGYALTEVGLVVAAVGLLAGFSSIFAAGAIFIVTQGLSDMADALKKFGEMTWGEILKGLVAMGGALREIGTVLTSVGLIAGFSSIFAAGAILIVIQGLDDLADALKKFGEMSWGEIIKGLTAMGYALTEIGVVLAGVGLIAGFSSIFAAGAILIVIQGLDDLAEALKKFGEMSWGEIGRGLVAMGGALLEVSVISGAMGVLTGLAGILGGAAIWVAVQGLGDLADALQKFGDMSWDEIGRGLAAMGGALGELALGGFLNTFAIIGAHSISEVAEPLGVLADSVKKWSGVTIPEHLGWQLATLANGVMSFTLGGLGALAISALAEPLGTLADSIKKWSDVSVPEGIGDQLAAIANGIGVFTWKGLAASSIASLAVPLGDLAGSIKKWADVTVPENIESNLTAIANGVKAFSWAFMGGWSIGAIVEPLGSLPESIKKWNGIVVPEGIEAGLTAIANGVKAFTWAFVGGWSLEAIVGPLASLSDSIKKWDSISIPSGIEEGLTSIANGVKAFFTWTDNSSENFAAIVGPIGSLSDSIRKWSGVTVPENIESDLKAIANGVKSFDGVDMAAVTSSVSAANSVANFMRGISGLDTSGVSSFVTGLTTLGNTGVDAFVNAFANSNTRVMAAVQGMVGSALTAINTKYSEFTTAGETLVKKFAKAIEDNASKAKTNAENMAKAAAKATDAQSVYDTAYSAGGDVVNGFKAGISANTFKAEATATAMALAALAKAKAALKINSPSKVFMKVGASVPEGFAMGIDKLGGMVRDSSVGMASLALSSAKDAVSRVASVLSSDIDAQPTIRPVLDLSDVRAGAGAIGNLFGSGQSIGVMANVGAISSMMAQRNQNGVNDDVVTAINKLRGELGNTGNTSYNINGITYDDGSNVAEAVRTIARAVKIERRV